MIRKIFVVFALLSAAVFAQMMQPKIVAQESEFNFGDINQGDVVTHVFIVSNDGGDLLKISNVTASCGCTAATPEKNELAPGESTNIVVKFNSKGKKGPQTKIITVYNNDPVNDKLQLIIKGNVLVSVGENSGGPAIYFPETQHDFGQVNEGNIVEYIFKFVNNGSSVLKIDDIKTSCGCTAALVSNKVLEPGQEGTLEVKLDTKNRTGKMSRTITIKSNDQKEQNKVLTVYADVLKAGS